MRLTRLFEPHSTTYGYPVCGRGRVETRARRIHRGTYDLAALTVRQERGVDPRMQQVDAGRRRVFAKRMKRYENFCPVKDGMRGTLIHVDGFLTKDGFRRAVACRSTTRVTPTIYSRQIVGHLMY
ncbi:hypothetical protein IQ289_25315 [Burkholderia sp. R-70006]|uniref:hypothetical protein n=1 Tax=Paraburkholderia domus TaxID=2793075 RepID=UPI001912E0C3|nr:hypothetical protein [Paraburkholderia domus]MBK5051705.1 hypothetical protein [Burkholderia sp. R-70006]